MFCAIINQETNEIIETREASREEMRPRLIELRETAPKIYAMATGETLEAAIDAARKLAAAWHMREEYATTLPEVMGSNSELPKEQWDQAMAKLGVHNRHRAANLAAHSWAVLDHEEGIVVVGHGQKQTMLLTGEESRDFEMPHICHTCKFGRTHLTSDREEHLKGLIPCSIGVDGEHYYIRKVHRSQTCSGWEKCKGY